MSTTEESRRNPKMIAKCLARCQRMDVCKSCVYEQYALDEERLGYGERCIDLLMEDARQVILALMKRVDLLELQVAYWKGKETDDS